LKDEWKQVTLHHQSHIVRFLPQRNPCEFSVNPF